MILLSIRYYSKIFILLIITINHVENTNLFGIPISESSESILTRLIHAFNTKSFLNSNNNNSNNLDSNDLNENQLQQVKTPALAQSSSNKTHANDLVNVNTNRGNNLESSNSNKLPLTKQDYILPETLVSKEIENSNKFPTTSTGVKSTAGHVGLVNSKTNKHFNGTTTLLEAGLLNNNKNESFDSTSKINNVVAPTSSIKKVSFHINIINENNDNNNIGDNN